MGIWGRRRGRGNGGLYVKINEKFDKKGKIIYQILNMNSKVFPDPLLWKRKRNKVAGSNLVIP